MTKRWKNWSHKTWNKQILNAYILRSLVNYSQDLFLSPVFKIFPPPNSCLSLVCCWLEESDGREGKQSAGKTNGMPSESDTLISLCCVSFYLRRAVLLQELITASQQNYSVDYLKPFWSITSSEIIVKQNKPCHSCPESSHIYKSAISVVGQIWMNLDFSPCIINMLYTLLH